MVTFRRIASVLVCLPILGLFVAAMSEMDRENWLKATRYYISQHEKGLFSSYRTNLDTYAFVKDLQSKALDHAKATGVIQIDTFPADPVHPWGGVYFTSVIKPGSRLHDEMRLGKKIAFAFWRHDGDVFRLLHIDTLGPSHIDWKLRPLRQVVGYH